MSSGRAIKLIVRTDGDLSLVVTSFASTFFCRVRKFHICLHGLSELIFILFCASCINSFSSDTRIPSYLRPMLSMVRQLCPRLFSRATIATEFCLANDTPFVQQSMNNSRTSPYLIMIIVWITSSRRTCF